MVKRLQFQAQNKDKDEIFFFSSEEGEEEEEELKLGYEWKVRENKDEEGGEDPLMLV